MAETIPVRTVTIDTVKSAEQLEQEALLIGLTKMPANLPPLSAYRKDVVDLIKKHGGTNPHVLIAIHAHMIGSLVAITDSKLSRDFIMSLIYKNMAIGNAKAHEEIRKAASLGR